MERSLRIQMIVLFLCILLLALGDAAAWARHYRVVAEPCPGRCKVRKLSLCSACMGGTRTCAQNLCAAPIGLSSAVKRVRLRCRAGTDVIVGERGPLKDGQDSQSGRCRWIQGST